MFTTDEPTFTNRNQPAITIEEHRRLKRQLFDARRRYAAVVHALREGVVSPAHTKKARHLENRISALELRLAFSRVIVPHDEPYRLRAAVHWWLAVWWVAAKAFAAAKFGHPARQHIRL